MFSIKFLLKTIVSNELYKISKKFPHHFVRSISISSALKKTVDEIEIDDYERRSIELEGSEDPEIKKKFINEETSNFHLPDKLPLARNYRKMAVLLPWVKWGPNKRHNVNPKLLLEEACALVNSIPNMEIVYKESVNLSRIVQNYIFTSGTLERLILELNMMDCDALFISMNYLKRGEILHLQESFRMPIFDRFMLVLDIFRYHAISAESKMQIQLAEMPYLNRGIITNEQKLWAHAHKSNLDNKLNRLSHLRLESRERRKKSSKDSIAIIGYTNCGKTTLIRGIASNTKLIGEDRLFATVDVTSHLAVLPCGIRSYFVDTVGFIQDIPINLIDSFRSTLEDAIYADVIVYMRDLSHPNFACQDESVRETLETMPIPKSTPIVVVNSKCDKIEEATMKELNYQHDLSGSINISAITGDGIFYMLRVIESKLLEVTGRKKLRLRLPIGSDKVNWLKEKIGIQEEEVDQEDINFCRVIVAMNTSEISSYRKRFKS